MLLRPQSPAFVVWIFFSALIVVFSFANMAEAQLGGDASQISVKITPEFPAPLQKVTIYISSFGINLNYANIAWTINGKPALTGRGEHTISFTAGNVGEETRVVISVTPQGGRAINQTIRIVPGEVDLIWEAVDAYTPPFYRGKALPASESQLRVVAIPTMKSGSVKLRSDTMVYRWKHNYKTNLPGSGAGKSTFLFKGGYTESIEVVEVVATSADGRTSASGKTSLEMVEPQVAIYENRPLEGIHYEEAVPRELVLDHEEIQMIAEPYFFSLPGGKADLSFSWLLNSREATLDSAPDAMTLRVPTGEGGLASIFLSVEHPKKLLQTQTTGLNIRFGRNE